MFIVCTVWGNDTASDHWCVSLYFYLVSLQADSICQLYKDSSWYTIKKTRECNNPCTRANWSASITTHRFRNIITALSHNNDSALFNPRTQTPGTRLLLDPSYQPKSRYHSRITYEKSRILNGNGMILHIIVPSDRFGTLQCLVFIEISH